MDDFPPRSMRAKAIDVAVHVAFAAAAFVAHGFFQGQGAVAAPVGYRPRLERMEAIVNHINAEAHMTDTFRNDVENRIAETAQAVKKAVKKRVTKAKGVVRKRVTKVKKTAATAIKRAKAFVKKAKGKVKQTKRKAAKGTPIGKAKAKTAAPKRKAAKTKKAAPKRSAMKSVTIVPPAI